MMTCFMQKDTTPEHLPKITLKPNKYEKKCQWWIDSCKYFDEQLVAESPMKKARNSQKEDAEPSYPIPSHDDEATYDSLGTGRREPSQPASQPGTYDSLRDEVQTMKETISTLAKRVDDQEKTINRLLKIVETNQVKG
jgi:hypothetical protein